ncbi:MAG: hypothetical protein EAS51_07970 [Microbacteriaceae bacterium]|nr:MAG: hypothetical protein EAS51_07970 [Microbacteriaceae bacterium]
MNRHDDDRLDQLLERARPYDPSTAPGVRAAVDELVARTQPARLARRRALAFGAGFGALALSFMAGATAYADDLRLSIVAGGDGADAAECTRITVYEREVEARPVDGGEVITITVIESEDEVLEVTVNGEVVAVDSSGCDA